MSVDYSRQSQIGEFLAQDAHERLADLVRLVVDLVGGALVVARVSANGADVDHAVAELDEGAALDGDVEVRDVVQDELDQLLVLRLADPLDEAVGRERHPELVCREPVLREAEVEERRDGHFERVAELFLLFLEVGPAHEADCYLLAQLGEEEQHLGGGILFGGLR